MDLSLIMNPVAATDLAKIPVELLDMILDFIIRPSDLKALCLVSRAVSEPAFRHLYRNIVLPYRVDDRAWVRVDRLSQSQHLHHVQSIDIGQSDLRRSDGFCRNLQPLLQRLPKNALKSFTYGLHGRPQAEDLITVWREQKSLRKLQLDFNLCAPSLLEVTEYLADELASLTSIEELEVDFGEEVDRFRSDEDDEDTSAVELFALLHVENLSSVELRYSGHDEARGFGFYGDSARELTLVSPYFPRTLTRLSLSFVCLPPPEEWPLSEYHALSALELYDCLNVAPILDSMTQPRLKHFEIRCQAARDTTAVYLATRSFLERFSALVSLSIEIDIEADNGEQLAPAICEHGLQLRSLRIDGYKEESGFVDLYNHRKFCPRMGFLALPLRMDGMLERCKVQDRNLSVCCIC